MKNAIIFLLLFNLVGCKKDAMNSIPQHKILLLKIDYLTYQFEGGHEQTLTSPFAPYDSLPIRATFSSTGDFNNLQLHYQPNHELIFDGDIVWNGWGPINYPLAFYPPTNYTHTGMPLPLPDTSRFQNVFPEWTNYKYPFDSIWMNIADLQIVNDYSSSPKNIGFLFYTPSIGGGNPAQWDWIIVMDKP